MHAISDDARESITRARGFAQAFVALGPLSDNSVAELDKHIAIIETGRGLLDLAMNELDDALASRSLQPGDGADA